MTGPMLPRWQVLTVAAFLGLAGCSTSSQTVVASSTPAGVEIQGFQLHTGDGFTVQLPEGWTVLEPEDYDTVWNEAAAELPGPMADRLLAQMRAVFTARGRLAALDLSDLEGSETPASLNIIHRESDGRYNPPEVASVLVDSAQDRGWTVVSSEIRQTAAGDAVMVRSHVFGPDETLSVLLLTDGAVWTMTFGAGDLDDRMEMFMTVIDSFRET